MGSDLILVLLRRVLRQHDIHVAAMGRHAASAAPWEDLHLRFRRRPT